MRVSLVSLNVDGLKTSTFKSYPKAFQNNPDIYVEFTQEDARQPSESVQSKVSSLLNVPNEYSFSQVKSLNKSATSQNIISKFFSKEKPLEFISGAIPVEIKGSVKGKLAFIGQAIATGYSKGAVYMYVQYPAQSFLFINCHLPINTKKNNYGYDYRLEKFEFLLNNIISKFSQDPNLFTVVGGDLNFRFLNNQNQLNTALQTSSTLKEFTEFPYLSEGDRAYTCKFKYNSAKACRLSPKGVEPADTSCRDEEREPSRCDRFLYKGDQIPQISAQYVDVLLDSSDHNAVLLDFSIEAKRTARAPSINDPTGVNNSNTESVASNVKPRGRFFTSAKNYSELSNNSNIEGGAKRTRKHRISFGKEKVRTFRAFNQPTKYQNIGFRKINFRTKRKGTKTIHPKIPKNNSRREIFNSLRRIGNLLEERKRFEKSVKKYATKSKAISRLRPSKIRVKRSVLALQTQKNRERALEEVDKDLNYSLGKLVKYATA